MCGRRLLQSARVPVFERPINTILNELDHPIRFSLLYARQGWTHARQCKKQGEGSGTSTGFSVYSYKNLEFRAQLRFIVNNETVAGSTNHLEKSSARFGHNNSFGRAGFTKPSKPISGGITCRNLE